MFVVGATSGAPRRRRARGIDRRLALLLVRQPRYCELHCCCCWYWLLIAPPPVFQERKAVVELRGRRVVTASAQMTPAAASARPSSTRPVHRREADIPIAGQSNTHEPGAAQPSVHQRPRKCQLEDWKGCRPQLAQLAPESPPERKAIRATSRARCAPGNRAPQARVLLPKPPARLADIETVAHEMLLQFQPLGAASARAPRAARPARSGRRRAAGRRDARSPAHKPRPDCIS